MSLKQTEKNDAATGIAGDGSARRGRAVLVGCVGLAAIVAAVAVGASR